MSANLLKIPLRIIHKMKQHAQHNFPFEACGLLAGTQKQILTIETVTNSLHSRTEFRMEPEEQLSALMKIEENNLDLLAIFHSHPTGPSHPSEQDMRLHYYPETAAIILSPDTHDWLVRGFLINKNSFTEIPIDILRE